MHNTYLDEENQCQSESGSGKSHGIDLNALRQWFATELTEAEWVDLFGWPIPENEFRGLQGPPGSGKTHKYTEAAARNLKFRNHAIFAPTKELSKQHAAMFREAGVPEDRVHLINEDTCESPGKKFVQTIMESPSEGLAVCATQQMYANLPTHFHDFMKKDTRWFRVVDEVPRAVEAFQIFLPKTYEVAEKWLLPHLTFTPVGKLAYVEVDDKNRDALKETMDWGKDDLLRDDILKVFDPLVDALLDEHKPFVIMEREPAEKLLLGELRRIDALIRYSLKPYGGALILGAHVEGSRFDYAARAEDMKLKPFGRLPLRDMSCVKEQCTFEYLVDSEVRTASKALYRTKDFQRRCDQIALAVLGGRTFLQLDNKKVPPIAANAVVLAGMAHGLNEYKKHKVAYVRGAFNPTPGFYRLAEKALGMSREAVNRDINIESTCQLVGRIGPLRDPGADGGRVIFPLRTTAEGVGAVYGITARPAVELMAWGAPDPGASTSAERKTLYRARAKALADWQQLRFEIPLKAITANRNDHQADWERLRREIPLKAITANRGDYQTEISPPTCWSRVQVRYSYLDNITDTLPKTRSCTAETFDKMLREQHRRTYRRKEDQPCITNCQIRDGGRRQNEDATGPAHFLFLDQDKSEGITPSELHQQLSSGAHGSGGEPVTWFYPTWRSTPEKPRWRAIVLLSRGVTAQEQSRLYTILLKLLLPKSLLDEGKQYPSAPFYLPGQPPNHPSPELTREGSRPLDVDALLAAFAPYFAVYEEIEAAREERRGNIRSDASLDEAEEALRSIPADDYQDWFFAACALKHTFGDEAFLVWDDWSRTTTAGNYSAKAARNKWKEIEKPKGKHLSVSWLFWKAKQIGFARR